MVKKYFLTFANTKFMSTHRLANHVKNMNVFDEIIQLNETHIPKFINKHKKFISQNPNGYGMWIWKPKIVLDTLLEIKENDILVYADAGIYANVNGIERLNYYFHKLDSHSIVAFSALLLSQHLHII